MQWDRYEIINHSITVSIQLIKHNVFLLNHLVLRAAVVALTHTSDSPGRKGLLRLLSLTPRVSNSVGSGWGQIIFISNKFPDDADTAGLGTIL